MDVDKTSHFYRNVLGIERNADAVGLPRAWFERSDRKLWIEVVPPTSSGPGDALLKSKAFGDGAILKIGVEVGNVTAFYDPIKTRGITTTAGEDATCRRAIRW